MPIEIVERYIVNGREFKSLAAATEHCADRLMEFIDPALGMWTPGEKLKLMEFLVDNRTNIAFLLDF